MLGRLGGPRGPHRPMEIAALAETRHCPRSGTFPTLDFHRSMVCPLRQPNSQYSGCATEREGAGCWCTEGVTMAKKATGGRSRRFP